MKFTPATLNGIRDILHPVRYNPYNTLMKRILKATINNCSCVIFIEGELSSEERTWLFEQGFQIKYMEDERIAVLW